jgi:arylsulfatase
VDCLRADHLGAYGYERDASPNIDEFSRNGVLFLSAVSASSFTLPTHASMLTGLPPSLHGATTRRKIAKSVPYLPKLLAEADYRVNGVVSAPFLSRFYGFERGFHTYRNMSARAAALVDYGLALLREGSGQDQFLFLHLMDAHWPYSPPGEFITRFGERPSDISGLFERFEQDGPASRMELDQIINLYDAEIAYLDQELGRFFDELKRMKLYNNSLIILTADHGEAFYEHGHWEHARPWQNDGPGLYEEVVRIPLIVKWPRESSSLEIPNVVSQMDIFPTMLEAAGMEPMEGWATSLRRYVDDASPPPTDRKVIAEITSHSEEAGAAMQIAFRSRDYKYIARFRSPSEEGLFSSNVEKEELYDLRNDPRETANLLVDSDRGSGPYREALRAYLAELRRSRPNLQGEAVAVDDSLLEELKKLGYIQNQRRRND